MLPRITDGKIEYETCLKSHGNFGGATEVGAGVCQQPFFLQQGPTTTELIQVSRKLQTEQAVQSSSEVLPRGHAHTRAHAHPHIGSSLSFPGGGQ